MIRFLLAVVSLFRPVYIALGVDFTQLRAIVGVKLVMDNRRNASAFPQRGKQKESNYKFLLAVLFYFIFGGFAAVAIAVLPSFLVGMTLYFSFLIVTIIMTLISDFSSVLLDTSDNTIVLPRPVSGKTLVAARTTHILLYLGQITLGLLLIPLGVVAFKYGIIFSILFIFATLLSVIFAVVFTNGFYLLLMQWTSEEKLKSIINYFQIVMTIVVMGGYQILPRIMGSTLEKITDFQLSWWSAFVPPMWMAGALQLFQEHTFDSTHLIAAAFAIGMPLGGFYLMNKYLTPKFASKLADLGTNSISPDEKEVVVRKGKFSLGSLIAKAGLESASYELVFKILSRDRKIKLKIYPSIGTLFIIAFVVLMQGRHKFSFNIEVWRESSSYIFLLYAPFFVVQTAVAEIVYTDEFRAAWIYTSTPIYRPGLILSGAHKAIIVKFFLPTFTLMALFVLFIWRAPVIDDILFAFSGNLFLFFASAVISLKQLPLSLDPTARTALGFIRVIMVMLVLGAVALAHFLVGKFVPILLWIGVPIALISTSLLIRAYQDTKWDDIKI